MMKYSIPQNAFIISTWIKIALMKIKLTYARYDVNLNGIVMVPLWKINPHEILVRTRNSTSTRKNILIASYYDDDDIRFRMFTCFAARWHIDMASCRV